MRGGELRWHEVKRYDIMGDDMKGDATTEMNSDNL